ncbi:oligosaccharide flippase family protein [Arthrospiribacter ruber]|uniref:Polysaccharide biosynthesis protein n=1 Tax=Arthrospiribacter ruber TaxID=2487934 RepID=A0A951IZ41_9BACT|nr:oligosaccharide flippase family protein [Arthrospiribacter ruber]MBW3468173.1 polysaccharide biosynthesis protein [Arthrospiribacter ruber]
MKTVAKQSILTTISSYIGVLIGYFNVLWLLPYALSPDQIGIFRTIQDMALLFVPFAQLGIGNGITRFYPKVKSHQFAFFTMSLLIGGVGFIILASLFFIFRESLVAAFASNSPEVIDFFGVVLFITFFSVLNSILDAFCRSFLKIAVPTFFREVILRLLVAILILLYLAGWMEFGMLMYGLAGVYLITLTGMVAYMKANGIFALRFSFGSFPEGFVKEFLQYSLITLLGTTGALLIMKIDSLMVTSMIGLEANAIYTIAFSIAIVIEMPRRAVSQVVMPVIAEHFAKGRYPEINKLYKDVAVHQTLICLLLFLGVWANIHNLYHFVPNNEIYEAGKWVVFWIGMGKITDIFFSVNGEIIVYSKYYLFNITATLLMSIAVILLNIFLIPVYGIEGAAVASFMAMLLYNVIKYIYVKIRLGFDPFSVDVIKILILGVVIFFTQHVLLQNMESGITDLLLRSVIISVLYLLGVYFGKIALKSQKEVIKKIKGLRP